jgi:CRISPR-associated protein Cas2
VRGGNTYVLIVYDVGVERINGVRQFLKQYLTWIQNSAFEGELSEGQLGRVKAGLQKRIKANEDSIIIFTTSSKKWLQKEVIGVEKAEVSAII